MATGGHSKMAAVGNSKIILWTPQNSLIIFTVKIDEGNILAVFQTYFGSLAVWFAYKHRASGDLSKMAVNWLQKPASKTGSSETIDALSSPL